jgi:hypothetical protein
MNKFTAAVVASVFALCGQAYAASETWLVTEENTAGVKGSQGSWTLTVDGDKLKGAAELQTGSGGQLTYKVNGTVAGGVYTVTLEDRSDGKKGCVWTGHAPSSGGAQTQGLVGYAECEGGKLIIRASVVH